MVEKSDFLVVFGEAEKSCSMSNLWQYFVTTNVSLKLKCTVCMKELSEVFI